MLCKFLYMSGIPRATVTRKLNTLLKKKYLKINDKKHYTLANERQKDSKTNDIFVWQDLKGDFVSQVFLRPNWTFNF